MNYQYVVFHHDYDYYREIFASIVKEKGCVAISGIYDVKNIYLKKVLNRLFPVNKKYTSLPYFLFPFIFCRKIQKNKPVCFIFFAGYANMVNAGLGNYLRKKYPGCVLVCRFVDIIEKMPYSNIDEYRQSFDILQTFDIGEAERYNLDYYPNFYSCSIDNISTDEPETDVLFVGRAKDRFDDILYAYDFLEKKGIHCEFYIVDVPEDKQILRKNVVYCSYLPYVDYLKRLNKSKCVLEIMQKDGQGETLRQLEAILFDKKLITNNKSILKKDYYDTRKISLYDEISDIDIDFLKNSTILYSSEEKAKISPLYFFYDLDRKISKIT